MQKCSFFVLLLIATLRLSGATLIWTNTAGGNWADAANWSPNQVPIGADDVSVTNAGTYVVAIHSAAVARSITIGVGASGTQTLHMPGAPLTVSNSVSVGPSGVLQALGTLNVFGDVVVSGEFHASSLVLGGSGVLDVTGGQLKVFGLRLSDRLVRNTGTVLIADGHQLFLGDNTAFTNFASGTLIFTNNNSGIQYNASFLNTNQFFANEGIIRVHGNSFIDVHSVYRGTIEVIAGELSLRRHAGYTSFALDVTAACNVAAGATLAFVNAETEFRPPASANGGGSLRVSGGSFNLTGAYGLGGTLICNNGAQVSLNTGSPLTLPHVHNDNLGDLRGPDPLTITGTLLWRNGGKFSGPAPLVLAATCQSTIESSGTEMHRPFMANAGTMNWISADLVLGTNSVFTNLPTASIVITNNEFGTFTFIRRFTGESAFYNAGLIRNTADTPTECGIPFFNTGTLRAKRGEFRIGFGMQFVQAAGVTELAGGSLFGFGNASYSFLGGALTGSGSIIGGNVTNAGAIVSPGASPGQINITGTIGDTGNGKYVQLDNATLNIEITGTNAGEFDRLIMTNSARLAGALHVTVADTFSAPSGTRLLFLSALSVSDQFTTFSFPTGQVALQLNYLTNGVELEVLGPMFLNPSNTILESGTSTIFGSVGGTAPITFSFLTNNSGASLNPVTGLYFAGPNTGVIDTIRGTDALGRTAQATIRVVPAMEITPASVTRASGETQTFTVTGGIPPYTVTFDNPSGASIVISTNPMNGLYTIFYEAGTNEFNQDQLNVHSAEGSFSASAAIQVVPTLRITPAALNLLPCEHGEFSAFGGEPPYTFSLLTSNSPCTLDQLSALTATYRICQTNGATNLVQLVDAAGRSVQASVTVIATNYDLLVTSISSSGPGTLHQAIVDANNSLVPVCRIAFLLPGPPPYHIVDALPAITRPVVIEGGTQPGFEGTPLVQVGGDGGSFGQPALHLATSNCVVRNLVIVRASTGVRIAGPGNVLEGNWIGTGGTGGFETFANGTGIEILSSNNRIGGTNVAARNVISGNRQFGIWMPLAGEVRSNVIHGNFIGTDPTGTNASPNQNAGIQIDYADAIIIGGVEPGAGNVIAFNFQEGIRIRNGTGHTIRGNSIFANSLLGINLGDDQVTFNDNFDTDSQANNGQNFPLITALEDSGSSTVVRGSFHSGPDATYTLDFYASPGCHSFGYGEGQRFLGTTDVMTDSSGNATFAFQAPPGTVADGDSVTVTATDLNGNTSEFSACSITTVLTSIAGQTSVAADPLGGVTITLSGSASGITNSAFNGSFSFQGLNAVGTYTVTPSRAGFIFTPPQISFTNLPAPGVAEFQATRVFRISGTVSDKGLNPVDRATVTLTGSASAEVLTDSTGAYTFNALTAGGTYTVSVSKAGLAFEPPITFNNLQSDRLADFSTVVVLRSIAGRVAASTGTGVPNVTLSLSDSVSALSGGLRLTAKTDANGNYQFANLPSDRSYTLVPTASSIAFSPASRKISVAVTNAAANFSATSAHFIQGTVKTAASGVGISNATVRFESTRGGLIGSAVTASNGAYSSALLPDGSNYVIRVSKPNFVFSPGKRNVDNFSNHVTAADFEGTEQLLAISGIVTNQDGFWVPGVRFNLSGAVSAQVDSASGSFSFPNLSGGLSYSVTPSKPGWSFLPTAITITTLATNQFAAFKAIPALPLTGKIVYVGFTASGSVDASALLMMNADSTEQIRLPVPSPVVSRPVFSPSGTTIAFPGAGSNAGLYRMNTDGTGEQRLASGQVVRPAWSPDGSRLAYRTSSTLKTINADGSFSDTPFVFPDGGQLADFPAWSPDGTQLAALCISGGNPEIFISSSNSPAVQVTSTGRWKGGLIWSPVTSKFAWSEDLQLYYGPVTGGVPVQLTAPPLSASPSCTWSPDGSLLAFTTADSDRSIIAINTNGTTTVTLVRGLNPSWGPLPAAATPVGSEVAVGIGGTSVIFDNVVSPGTTTVNPILPVNGTNFAPPGYVTIAGAGMAFDVSTTASNTGPITLCFTVSNITDRTLFESLRIQHAENGQLVDRTIRPGVPLPGGCDTNLVPNFTNKTICACVTSLSPFFIQQKVDDTRPQVVGIVVDADGSPLPRATVELAGPFPVQTLTDLEGRFTFANLEETNTYTIVATGSDYDFTPPIAVVEHPAGMNSVVFIASRQVGPALNIVADVANPGRFKLIWPVLSEQYVLESSNSLSPGNWGPAPEAAAVEGVNVVVSVQASPETRYFRLTRQ